MITNFKKFCLNEDLADATKIAVEKYGKLVNGNSVEFMLGLFHDALVDKGLELTNINNKISVIKTNSKSFNLDEKDAKYVFDIIKKYGFNKIVISNTQTIVNTYEDLLNQEITSLTLSDLK